MSAPLRTVKKVHELAGPRGGTVYVMDLDCGHRFWRRSKRPPMRTRCVGCWLEANNLAVPNDHEALLADLEQLQLALDARTEALAQIARTRADRAPVAKVTAIAGRALGWHWDPDTLRWVAP